MDYRDTDDEAQFRAELRLFLSDHADQAAVPHDPAQRADAQNRWHQVLHEAGYVALSFPSEVGGHSKPVTYDAILNDELGRAGAPPIEGIGHLCHALLLFGTDAQRAELLPGLLSGRVRWCQGFSEPDAGSDLASLTTRASLVGDGSSFCVSGRKIWTSFAAVADWCFLLCRTEPDAPKHKGLSVLLVPMSSAGVTASPITNAARNREFAEVTFDEVMVPAANLLGQRGQGWSIATQLLAFERGPSDINWIARLSGHLSRLERDVRDGVIPDDDTTLRLLGHAHVRLRALQLKVQRSLGDRARGLLPGAEGSVDKLLMTDADQTIGHALLQLRGVEAVLAETPDWDTYVWSRAASIYGGTQQVQRTIVAERLLGLPRP